MSLFQKSVLKKYVNALDIDKLDAAWSIFKAHFHNATIQANIRNSKEEQYQGEFLIDLFVKVFGYVKNPNPDFNLTTELKNIKGAKKTDGAILQEGNALAVIELKGTKVTDLNKIETQAFGYKNNHPECVYVITSNFEKLRFYIDNAVDYEEFNLFKLTKDQFDILWLCLSADSLLKGIPKNIKDESLTQEDRITKQLYKDYSTFRNEIFQSIIKLNPDHDKLTLFKKTQKLLDRFLFIFFAEDRLLLPPNSIREIIRQWTTLKDELDAYTPLYDRFKKYFGYLNIGHKGKKHDIFAYNGGLFASDDILDNIKIDDTLLYNHSQKLSNYDFESEVSVNILGHIFEHSLNEIEEIQAEIEGIATDKSKSKRKKDGVFYTPKYITKYIVDNTIGKLCKEKKEELGIDEEEYEKDRKGRKVKTLKALQAKLETYREWLLQLTICDPACGSGAFLNQALEFLIAEHQLIDELMTKLLGGELVLPNVENTILENNLFGVDINNESVEIAKLSLWLRTAKHGRKLTALNDNIKCGNSLIDDPEVAGNKAFRWEAEFPEVFAKGGFDVVIGNPPYVRQELFSNIKGYLENNYETFQGTADLYVYFFEISIKRLLNPRGLYSIIVANKWMRSRYGRPLRKWLKKYRIEEIIDFGDLNVFNDVSAYPCIITISTHSPLTTFSACIIESLNLLDLDSFVNKNKFSVTLNSLQESGWALVDNLTSELTKKLRNQGITLDEFTSGKIYRGITTGLNEAFIINKEVRNDILRKDPKNEEYIKPYLRGRDIKRYNIPTSEDYLIYSPWDLDLKRFPILEEHFINHENKLKSRPEVKEGRFPWYSMSRYASDYWQEFENPKIVVPDISLRGNFALDRNNSLYLVNTAYIICNTSYSLLGILNSKLITFFYKNISPQVRGGYLRFTNQYLSQLPIKKFDQDDTFRFEVKVEKISNLKTQINSLITSFTKVLVNRFSLEKLSKLLENWHFLNFDEFTKALSKKKVRLNLSEEAEWMQYFEEQKDKVLEIQQQIDQTDREIDQMVYELYGLTEEEVGIVEEATR